MSDTENDDPTPPVASSGESRPPVKDITPAATNIDVAAGDSTRKSTSRRNRPSANLDTPDPISKPTRTRGRNSQGGAADETPARSTRTRSSLGSKTETPARGTRSHSNPSEPKDDVTLSGGRRRSGRKSKN